MKKKDQQVGVEQELFAAILQLQSTAECRQFFYDLLTPAEVEEFSDRLQIAQLLQQDLPYRQIAEQMGVSTTTVGRVARFLHRGHDGYKMVLQRLSGDVYEN